MLAAVPALLLASCTATVRPPTSVDDPATVYLADYGYHATILLPTPDEARLVEYAYGDWCWYALGHDALVGLPFTLVVPTRATLGRGEHPRPATVDELGFRLACDRPVAIVVERARVDELRTALDAIHAAHRSREVRNEDFGLDFVRLRESYHLGNTCNHEMGRWLRQLGCGVRGVALWGDYRFITPEAGAAGDSGG
ncbi:MAG: hypothetical protein KDA25_04245 [Phycisphaerales bacterium]|nr:hypothetical protein [Phycisphaerales bacterium]